MILAFESHLDKNQNLPLSNQVLPRFAPRLGETLLISELVPRLTKCPQTSFSPFKN